MSFSRGFLRFGIGLAAVAVYHSGWQAMVPGIAGKGLGRAEAQQQVIHRGEARRPEAPPKVDLTGLVRSEGRFMAPLHGGGVARLSLEPKLMATAEEVLNEFNVPVGAVAVVSVRDGRVLALVGKSANQPSLGITELALRPWAPAASVFKVITASALVEEAGLNGNSRACYHGGLSSLGAANLVDIPALDKRCDTLSFGLAKSQNAIFAKLAVSHLGVEALDRTGRAFGFGAPLPFDAELAPSELAVPEETLEFARASAGFWHSSLSVLHGALLAATIANAGVMPAPRLIDKAVDSQGASLVITRNPSRRVISPATAAEVGHMMEQTTKTGTARGAFHDRRGHALLPIDVAGKTGSLNYRGAAGDPLLPMAVPADGHLAYSWFVGYAPANKPEIAFAVLLGNQAVWRIKAAYVAKVLVAEHLASKGDTRVARLLATR